MSFGNNNFSGSARNSFGKGLSKGFEGSDFNKVPDFALDDNPFKFTPKNNKLKSRIRFYDHDSLWARWRRGYELYTITQSVLGSSAVERSSRGDYRMYCSYQQFPGVFIPARVFTFPSTSQEIGEQIVGMRDTNGFNFYNFGLPIIAVRYLGNAVTATYSQSGTTIVVTKADHNLQVGENIYLTFTSGGAVNATLIIVSKTQNSFTCTASAPLTTGGNVTYYLSTVFNDIRWTTTRVRLRFLPTPVTFFAGERLADRIIEKDPGVFSSYSRVGSLVTINCTQPHGLSTSNRIFIAVISGLLSSGQYDVTVTSTTQLTITTLDSGTTSGSLVLNRLIQGYRYDNFVGYTVMTTDATTNEIVFQRADSYGTSTVNGVVKTTVPAHRGFEVGRFLTTELRYQCSCQDYLRREGYNLFDELVGRRFPVTPISSTKGGFLLNKDGSISDRRDDAGIFGDLGYITINNFYQLPDYKDKAETSYPNLMYYQLRWCKHIYAAMWSLAHDEGNQKISINSRYTQAGPNITIYAQNHGLAANTKIQIEFTSGSAISGDYSITQVIDANTFIILYPFNNTTSGYCTVSNLKQHEYVGAWLLEPNDKPVGDDLDTFYFNFAKENEKIKKNAERLVMMQQGMKWVGSKSITGSRNQPEQTANSDPQLVTMMMTDEIRRNNLGQLDRAGTLQNSTQRMIAMMSKLLNLVPEYILGTKFGMLDEPLINYNTSFQFAIIQGGLYLNGNPTEDPATLTAIECSTYDPLVAQDTIVDSGFYINT